MKINAVRYVGQVELKAMNENNVCIMVQSDYPEKPRAGWRYRFWAGAAAVLCMGVLVLAGYVTPAANGLGTHQQLNLPACGFYERTGYPCPTCGMTTAFAYMVRGRVLQSFIAQPGGALAAICCILAVPIAGYITITGRWIDRLDRYIYLAGVNWLWVTMSIVAVALLSWCWLCLLVYLR